MDKSQFCYWCGAPANSREHVPPRCFFPNEITKNRILKKQKWSYLITVPSCTEHNNQKSNWDEYLLAHIAPFALGNLYSQALFQGKILRAWNRKKDLLKPTRFDGTNIYFDCNDHIICFEIEGIARALYLVENKIIFVGKLCIFNGQYSIESDFYWRNAEAAKSITNETHIWNTEVKGLYPEIFTYQFSPTDQKGCTSLILTFYESVRVFVVLADKAHSKDRNYSFEETLQLGASININPWPSSLEARDTM